MHPMYPNGEVSSGIVVKFMPYQAAIVEVGIKNIVMIVNNFIILFVLASS